MILRNVREDDLEKVAKLYKECYNIVMNLNSYNFWHLKDYGYSSLVCEVDGEVVGHNGLVDREYIYNGDPIKVALSIGGMVSPYYKKPGLFLKMLNHSINNYSGDCIIAFPNKNAEPFWCRILKYNTLEDNYFSITPESLNFDFKEEVNFNLQRTEKFIIRRTKNHPRYNYDEHTIGDFKMITKEYNGNIELVYINKISPEIVAGLKNIFNQGFKKINTINIYKDQLQSLGFVKGHHNLFVYKWYNEKYKDVSFECQMIDSDVF